MLDIVAPEGKCNMANSESAIKSEQELTDITDDAQDVLMRAETVFPFTLFPDTITIDRIKVTVAKRSFFRVAEVISIQIEDFLNVEVDVGPYFGSIKLWTRFFTVKPLTIHYLRRDDAITIKKILQGYIIARNRKIDCSSVPKNELLALLFTLGEDAESDT